MDADKLAEARRVVVANRLGVAERFHCRIRRHNLVFERAAAFQLAGSTAVFTVLTERGYSRKVLCLGLRILTEYDGI